MTSVFDFKSIKTHYPETPNLSHFNARDGSSLSYRFYDSPCRDVVCILLHGSSAHGEYLHPLASYLSSRGGGKCMFRIFGGITCLALLEAIVPTLDN